MSRPCSTSRRWTFLPSGPVWCVTSCIPKIFFTAASASARVLATLTPPPLPRPPAWICALTTTTSVPACCWTLGIAASASSTVIAGMPIGTGTPYFWKSCLPWYSWIFTGSSYHFFSVAPRHRIALRGRPMRAALLVIVLAGCTTAATDDGEAEMAPPQPVGKTDAAQFLGLYASHATHHYNGDVPDLELRSDGQFVRERCYHASCALEVPETGAFDQYTSSTGHTYVRFYSAYDASKVLDVYEIRTFTKGVQLRKAYSTRWVSLYLSSAGLACASSGGTYTGTDCACPGNQPTMYPAQVFVPGAGDY